MLCLDLVDLKLRCQRLRMYARPDNEDIIYLCEHLPSSSGLRRMVVDSYAKDRPLSDFGGNKDTQADWLGGLQHAFVVEALVCAKAHIGAVRCHNGSNDECNDPADHGNSDFHDIPSACTFHEHGGDEEEREMCGQEWAALWRAYCDNVTVDERQDGGDQP